VMMTPPGYRFLSCTRKKLQGGPKGDGAFDADFLGTLHAIPILSPGGSDGDTACDFDSLGRIGIRLGANRNRKDRRPRSLTFLQSGVYGRQHMVEPGTRGFEGQMAFVTGAASGSRRATARAFGAQDGRVFGADAILFFASRRAGFITGQVLSVSGGLTMAG